MSMEAKVLDSDKQMACITVVGDLDNSQSAKLLEEVERQIANGISQLVFDFTELQFVSSVGIGVMAFASKEMVQRKGQLHIVCVNQRALYLIDLAKIHHTIRIHSTLEEAIASVGE